MQLHVSDLEKIYDALEWAWKYQKSRDEMNAAQHQGVARYSPLTTTLELAMERAGQLAKELRDENLVTLDSPSGDGTLPE